MDIKIDWVPIWGSDVLKPSATVNGWDWGWGRTAQALEDARYCRCKTCVCCLIRRAVFETGSQVGER